MEHFKANFKEGAAFNNYNLVHGFKYNNSIYQWFQWLLHAENFTRPTLFCSDAPVQTTFMYFRNVRGVLFITNILYLLWQTVTWEL